MSGRCSLTPILRLLGRGFLARTRISTLTATTLLLAARRDAAKRALENAQKLEPNSPETLLALGYYQYWVLRDYGAAKTTFESRQQDVTRQQRGANVPSALVARREGHWDQSIAYFEQALALDPRNVELLMDAAETYAMLRQFPAALKLYDRALDITPNDPDVMAAKASIYQAQGNLQEAAKLLIRSKRTRLLLQFLFETKITQLRLERNYGEAVRLLQARLAQFHFASEYREGLLIKCRLLSCSALLATRLAQRLPLNRRAIHSSSLYRAIKQLAGTRPSRCSRRMRYNCLMACAVMGEKDSAIKIAEGAIMLLPRANDAAAGPLYEENLALIRDNRWGEQPCNLNSHPVVTNALQ